MKPTFLIYILLIAHSASSQDTLQWNDVYVPDGIYRLKSNDSLFSGTRIRYFYDTTSVMNIQKCLKGNQVSTINYYRSGQISSFSNDTLAQEFSSTGELWTQYDYNKNTNYWVKTTWWSNGNVKQISRRVSELRWENYEINYSEDGFERDEGLRKRNLKCGQWRNFRNDKLVEQSLWKIKRKYFKERYCVKNCFGIGSVAGLEPKYKTKRGFRKMNVLKSTKQF